MATIDDVAKQAGVSTSTVSYVLSGKRPISAPTKARVEAAIAQLGYRPHAGARALARNKTNVLGLVAPLRTAVNVNVIMRFVAGVAQAAREHNYDVLLLTQDDIAGIDRILNGSQVDAVITMDIEEEDPRLPILRAATQPAVLIGIPADPAQLSCVDLDFTDAGTQAVRHLTQRGHTRIGLITAGTAVWERHTTFLERLLTGVRNEAEKNTAQLTVLPCESSENSARDTVDALLAQEPNLTALIIHNEYALPYVIARLRELGKTVPHEISVIAICPTDLAINQPQPLTSIDVPGEEIGRTAVTIAMNHLDNETPAETRLLRAVLTERGSTAFRN
ncbi:LacI family DNA-binding transcriptional regulator [Timonella sp. A28]|uniref:LacI family DNA-binding transcriptional regulator n=1 Tax=Timonella sp. A28 TaxID=3442640 RepID=UPI003EBE6225